MNYLLRILTLGIIPVLLYGILGLTNTINLRGFSSDIRQVSQKQEESEKNKTITINGIVKKIVPLVGSIAYQVEDNTGTIWVVSENKPPEIGAKIVIKGIRQYQSIPIGEEELGEYYVIETNKQD
jgi:hypothetical protein